MKIDFSIYKNKIDDMKHKVLEEINKIDLSKVELKSTNDIYEMLEIIEHLEDMVKAESKPAEKAIEECKDCMAEYHKTNNTTMLEKAKDKMCEAEKEHSKITHPVTKIEVAEKVAEVKKDIDKVDKKVVNPTMHTQAVPNVAR